MVGMGLRGADPLRVVSEDLLSDASDSLNSPRSRFGLLVHKLPRSQYVEKWDRHQDATFYVGFLGSPLGASPVFQHAAHASGYYLFANGGVAESRRLLSP